MRKFMCISGEIYEYVLPYAKFTVNIEKRGRRYIQMYNQIQMKIHYVMEKQRF